ncbi:MAG TPA: pirin family protein [Myxococcales bacterium]|nr:pirin family protein [Myxococcales bacterium]
MPRTVRNIHRAERDDIADLVTRRPLPSRSIESLDPFLFLNHHGPQAYPPGNRGLPFGPHPHRGFETVTFILDGDLLHRDSGGHESVIGAGGAQWMTAGRGLVHAELSSPLFMDRGGPLEILQLWVNLPARLKMTEPRYLGVQREQVPRLSLDGATVSLISGELLRTTGPIASLTGVWMSTVSLAPGASVRLPAPRGRAVFLYVARGALSGIPAFHLVELNDDADEVELRSPEGATVLFGHGAPLGEPVVAQGPFVMNTREEIVQAIRDYHAGLFGPPMD